MSSLKSNLLAKARRDIQQLNTCSPPSPKWCPTCKFRYHDKGGYHGENLTVCRKYNDNSPGLKSKPGDVLYGGASCPDYKEGDNE